MDQFTHITFDEKGEIVEVAKEVICENATLRLLNPDGSPRGEPIKVKRWSINVTLAKAAQSR